MSRFLMIFCIVLLAGCATTPFQNVWKNEQYAQANFSNILVLAEHQSEAERRLWEDALVKAITDSGHHASAGYIFVSEDLETKEEMFAVAQRTNADAIIMTRLHGSETRTQITTEYIPGHAWVDWYGHSRFWWYARPEVYQYQVAIMEVSLFDVAAQALVWTGTIEIVEPISDKNTNTSKKVVKTLQKEGFLK